MVGGGGRACRIVKANNIVRAHPCPGGNQKILGNGVVTVIQNSVILDAVAIGIRHIVRRVNAENAGLNLNRSLAIIVGKCQLIGHPKGVFPRHDHIFAFPLLCHGMGDRGASDVADRCIMQRDDIAMERRLADVHSFIFSNKARIGYPGEIGVRRADVKDLGGAVLRICEGSAVDGQLSAQLHGAIIAAKAAAVDSDVDFILIAGIHSL